MNRQRALVMAALPSSGNKRSRRWSGPLRAERSELLLTADAQRLATLAWATAERREAIADLRGDLAASMEALRAERAILVSDLRHIIDVVPLRVALFLVAAVVLAPLVAHALRSRLAAPIARKPHGIALSPTRNPGMFLRSHAVITRTCCPSGSPCSSADYARHSIACTSNCIRPLRSVGVSR